MTALSQERLLWCAFLAVLLLLSWTQVADYDFWWHINLGRQVLGEGTPLILDRFSFTFSGVEQYNAEWLADLTLYLVYATGGFTAINLFKFLILAGTFYCLWQASRERLAEDDRSSAYAIVACLVVVLFAIRFRLFVRPFLFSYLFFAAFLWVLTRYARLRNHRILWLLPLLALLWANSSKGIIFGPLLMGLWCGFDLAGKRFDPRLLMTCLAVCLVSLVNPDGADVYRMTLAVNLSGAETAALGEQRPLSTYLLWGGGWSYTWGFQLLVVLGVCHLLWRGRRDLRAWILLAVFIAPAIKMIRMIDFFSLTAIFFVVPLLAGLLDKPWPRQLLARRFATPLISVLLVLSGGVAVIVSDSYAFGSGVKPGHAPVEAVEFLTGNGIAGPVFNSYPYGGYIAWQAPQLPVYIDGRVNQLYPQEFHKRYKAALHSPQVFLEEQQKWGFKAAVLEYDLRSDGLHFPRHLADDPSWALVWWDSRAAVYLKREPRFAALIERFAYRLAKPAFYTFNYVLERARQGSLPELLAAARHDIALNPDNQEPRLAYVNLLFLAGYRQFADEILAELDRCIALSPDLAVEYVARGKILQLRGRLTEAARDAERALQLNPGSTEALALRNSLVSR